MTQWFQLSPFAGALLIVILADIITGLLLAAKQRRLNSRVGRDGMYRKTGMLMLLALCAALEKVLDVPLVEWVAAALAVPELISIVENLTMLGVPVPPQLTKFFSLLPSQKQPGVVPVAIVSIETQAAPAAPSVPLEAPGATSEEVPK